VHLARAMQTRGVVVFGPPGEVFGYPQNHNVARRCAQLLVTPTAGRPSAARAGRAGMHDHRRRRRLSSVPSSWPARAASSR